MQSARYTLDLVSVQDVMWDIAGTVKERGLYFLVWERKIKSSIENRTFCTPQNSIGTEESRVCDKMSYTVSKSLVKYNSFECACNI
jgi:hypothetical protein